MQFTQQLNFLGMESFVGKKDPSKTFYRVSFLEDTDSFTVFVGEPEILITVGGLKRMDLVECDFTLKIGQYINLYLNDIRIVNTSVTAKSADTSKASVSGK